MIKFLDLQKISAQYAGELQEAARRVIDSGWYLRGKETKGFEQEYARFTGTKFCIATGNGLDALTLILRAYKEMGLLTDGDEVLVPANTFVASILAITENGLKPVLVEPRPDTLEIDEEQLEKAVTPHSKALMTVHLYGRLAYSENMAKLCRERGLLLIEDNAQAHGCKWNGRHTGSLGDAAGHSFYPGKNMGALGDAGAVTTDNAELADCVRMLAYYGSKEHYEFEYQGQNSRMDEIQAAFLRVKLNHLEEVTARRRQIAAKYCGEICNPLIQLPPKPEREEECVWHLFPVLCSHRDDLQKFFLNNDIQTAVHYPIPPHKQKCFREWNTRCLPVTEKIHREELSLPVSQALTDTEVQKIIDTANRFKIKD